MSEFADVWPGLIVQFARGLRQRSVEARKRPGRLAELAGALGAKVPNRREPLVIEGDWHGPGTSNGKG